MLSPSLLLATRSPIRRLKCRTFRGTPKPRRHAFLSLESALACGDPHLITVAFLHSAQRDGGAGSAGSSLRRVLSCASSRESLLCACAAVATPADLWPTFVLRRVQAQRGARDAVLTSPSWRAFFFALLRCIHSTEGAQVLPWLPVLCATCLSPSVELGERLAELSCVLGDGGSPNVVAADAAVAFAACCSMNAASPEGNNAAWLRLWAKVRASAPSDALQHPAWVRCYELQLCCFMRIGRHSDIEALLLDTITPPLLHRMSEATLARLFLLEPLDVAARRGVLSALLSASRAKNDALVALRLSPFELNNRLPSVTQSSNLFAQAMQCLVLQARSEPSTGSCLQVLRDIEGLCRMSNSYALAASLVPNGSDGGDKDDKDRNGNKETKSAGSRGALASVLTGSPSMQRARLLAVLVKAVDEVVELACDFSHQTTSYNDCVEATLRGCIGVLTGLFTLCSARRGQHLLRRRAEPEWRRRLRQGVAVRSHKYELLCGELPHNVLSRCISTLLFNGYVSAGGSLGCHLAAADFVDLHFYPLRLLGSLYHAARVVGRQAQQDGQWRRQQQRQDDEEENVDVLVVIRSLYQRRREVFGEDVSSLEKQASAADPSGDALVPHDMMAAHPLALRHTCGERGTAGLGLLLARSTVAAGGSFVVDGSFGVWLRKATVQVSKY